MFNKNKNTLLTVLIIIFLVITVVISFNKTIKENSFSINEQNKTTSKEIIVWDGLTMKELTEKLDRTLSSTLTGYGYLFAEKSIEIGLDPYLAVAITMHETGCKWGCSSLLKNCNNVAGIKGKPGCNGGSYKKFDSLEEGITYFIKMLYNNYYSKGLNTPELINPRYAEDKAWANKVNKYIENIKKA